jgi:hypothetical protein
MQMVRGFIEQLQVISNQQVKPQVKRSPALTAQLEGSELATLLIIQSFCPDWFFSAFQQQRLSELMNLWRTARDRGQSLPPEQQAELDKLVEAELKAATARTAALVQQLNQ